MRETYRLGERRVTGVGSGSRRMSLPPGPPHRPGVDSTVGSHPPPLKADHLSTAGRPRHL